jgi:hypothetical protein
VNKLSSILFSLFYFDEFGLLSFCQVAVETQQNHKFFSIQIGQLVWPVPMREQMYSNPTFV